MKRNERALQLLKSLRKNVISVTPGFDLDETLWYLTECIVRLDNMEQEQSEYCDRIAKDLAEEPKRMVEFLEALKADQERGDDSLFNWNRKNGD